jgi:hypothetical protein
MLSSTSNADDGGRREGGGVVWIGRDGETDQASTVWGEGHIPHPHSRLRPPREWVDAFSGTFFGQHFRGVRRTTFRSEWRIRSSDLLPACELPRNRRVRVCKREHDSPPNVATVTARQT